MPDLTAALTADTPCRECKEGKHDNCDGTALDSATDTISACPCKAAGHGRAARVIRDAEIQSVSLDTQPNAWGETIENSQPVTDVPQGDWCGEHACLKSVCAHLHAKHLIAEAARPDVTLPPVTDYHSQPPRPAIPKRVGAAVVGTWSPTDLTPGSPAAVEALVAAVCPCNSTGVHDRHDPENQLECEWAQRLVRAVLSEEHRELRTRAMGDW